jgi:phosphotransferase family enzyme
VTASGRHDSRGARARPINPRRPWARWQLAELLAASDLDGLPQEPFPHDGWSGSALSLIDRGDRRFVLKRTSAALDWIVRATRDNDLREAWFASALASTGPDGAWIRMTSPYLGAAAVGDGAAILMPDLSDELIAWDRPSLDPGVPESLLVSVLTTAARLHFMGRGVPAQGSVPWCPLPERILLLTRPAAEGYRAGGNPVGERFIAGWDAFDRLAPAAARGLVQRLADDPQPLVAALGQLPSTMLHGDLKLSNVASMPDGIAFIDWQMATFAPVAVELGWLLVSNVAQLPEAPEAILERYRSIIEGIARDSGLDPGLDSGLESALGDWDAQVDLAILVGLLLRGWRKGLDAEAGRVLPTGVAAADDLAWWSDRALEAAAHRL